MLYEDYYGHHRIKDNTRYAIYNYLPTLIVDDIANHNKPKPAPEPPQPQPPQPTPPQPPQPPQPAPPQPSPNKPADFNKNNIKASVGAGIRTKPLKANTTSLTREQVNKAKMVEASKIVYENSTEETIDFTKAQRFLDDNNINYNIDPELSTRENLVLIGDDGDVKVAYRGTDIKNTSDLTADAMIPFGIEEQHTHFTNAYEQMNEVISKYGKPSELVGYSLGGNKAMSVGDKFNIETTTFNPYLGKKLVKGSSDTPHTIIKTTEDIASAPLALGGKKNWNVISIKPSVDTINPVEAHKLENFTNNTRFNTNTDIELTNFRNPEIPSNSIIEPEIRNPNVSTLHQVLHPVNLGTGIVGALGSHELFDLIDRDNKLPPVVREGGEGALAGVSSEAAAIALVGGEMSASVLGPAAVAGATGYIAGAESTKFINNSLVNAGVDHNASEIISGTAGGAIGGGVGALTSIATAALLGTEIGSLGGPLGVLIGVGVGAAIGLITSVWDVIFGDHRTEEEKHENYIRWDYQRLQDLQKFDKLLGGIYLDDGQKALIAYYDSKIKDGSLKINDHYIGDIDEEKYKEIAKNKNIELNENLNSFASYDYNQLLTLHNLGLLFSRKNPDSLMSDIQIQRFNAYTDLINQEKFNPISSPSRHEGEDDTTYNQRVEEYKKNQQSYDDVLNKIYNPESIQQPITHHLMDLFHSNKPIEQPIEQQPIQQSQSSIVNVNNIAGF